MTTDEIKQSVSMLEVVERYGLRPNRAGFVSCPFHKERTASMKIYKDSSYCFGCGRTDDVFSFVQGMEHCDFKTAYKALGGSYKQSTDYQHNLYRYRMEKRKETENKRLQRIKEEKHNIFEEIRLQNLFVKLFPVFSDDWCDSINRLEYLFYRLECIEKGSD